MRFSQALVPVQVGSGASVSAPPNPVSNLLEPVVARAQSSSAAVESSHPPSGERVGNVVPMEVGQWTEPTVKSRALVGRA